jgi:uncharacterized membrane protein YdbT with pleckstrin-like domain
MRCPACGTEVIGEAAYCHRCGHRVDQEQQPLDREGWDAARAEPADGGPAAQPEAAVAQEPTPAERLRQAATARHDDEVETELWEGGYSPRAMMGNWIVTAAVTAAAVAAMALFWNGWVTLILLLAVLALWAYQAGLLAYRRMSVSYRLTTQRFIHQSGLLRRVTDRIEIIDIDDIAYEQGLVERLLGVGTVRISSSDRTHPELPLRGIENVRDIADAIDDARRAERRRRGLHIESI